MSQNGILASILLNSGAVDFVVTGCGTGAGAMLALNSFPGVVCGHAQDPVDTFTFSQVNAGNAIAFPLCQRIRMGVRKRTLSICSKNFSVSLWGKVIPKRELRLWLKTETF